MSAPTTLIISSLPFLATFLFVATIVLQRILPILSGEAPSSKSNTLSQPLSSSKPTSKRISALVFCSTVALAAVLVELILCEISNTLNAAARGTAFHVVISLLLLLLIVAIPFLEIHSVITSAGYQFTGSGQGRLKVAWVLQVLSFTAWLLGFWWSGDYLLGKHEASRTIPESARSIVETSLERIGVIGISVMSLLSGFASVSSPWQNFFSRPKPVTETALARKVAGLDATQEMLSTKRSRLRALEQKMLEAPTESFFQKAIGSIRGNADHTERQTLLLEISGLETMALSLSSSYANLQARFNQQERSRTPTGRLVLTTAYIFSIFCLYRIVTTTLTFIRRSLSSHRYTSENFTTSDPVDNILALLAKHYDPHLDQAVWARQISFLLSGVILFASFSTVMQTFRLFARFLPSLLKAIQANLALVVAQVCATYVISAALMLRGMMPGSVMGEGLKSLVGGEDDMRWVDGWFERWFLCGVVITFVGIWFGRKFSGSDDWDDDFDDGGGLEMGKRS